MCILNCLKKPFSRIFFTLFIFSAFSCGKKWKEPTQVTMVFEIKSVNTGNQGSPGALNIYNGSVNFSSIELSGERKQGDDIFLSQNSNSSIDVNTGAVSPSIHFDIPQGTYDYMRFKITCDKQSGDNSILLMGTYTKLNNQVVPVRFELASTEYIEILPKENNNSDEVVLVKDVARNLVITVDVENWFSSLTTTLFEDADLTNISGQPTILINTQNNSTIFTNIINRIPNGFSAKFQ